MPTVPLSRAPLTSFAVPLNRTIRGSADAENEAPAAPAEGVWAARWASDTQSVNSANVFRHFLNVNLIKSSPSFLFVFKAVLKLAFLIRRTIHRNRAPVGPPSLNSAGR